MGCGVGEMVSMFAVFSNNPSLNPTEVYSLHSVDYVFKYVAIFLYNCGWKEQN